MKTDKELKVLVQDELEWDPSFNGENIGVAVKNGVVTINGHVNSWAEKLAIEKAVKRVQGVKAYVEEIDVKIKNAFKRTDEEIAEVALKNLKWNTTVPDDKIVMKVENGWITLEGKVNWNYQKEAAKKALKELMGVRGITNLIEVDTVQNTGDLKEKIRKSFERNAQIDANHIDVQIVGEKVILTGTVQSWAEKKQAEKVVYFAPGVKTVENKIVIEQRQMAF